ncbi:MAG: hypothetical protein AAF442_00180 [Pseudomonadota bacterium]
MTKANNFACGEAVKTKDDELILIVGVAGDWVQGLHENGALRSYCLSALKTASGDDRNDLLNVLEDYAEFIELSCRCARVVDGRKGL